MCNGRCISENIFLTYLSWPFSSKQEEWKEKKKKPKPKPSRYCFLKEWIKIIKYIKITVPYSCTITVGKIWNLANTEEPQKSRSCNLLLLLLTVEISTVLVIIAIRHAAKYEKKSLR